MIRLCRLDLSGQITIETPSCVFLDVAPSLMISVDEKELSKISYRARFLSTTESAKSLSVSSLDVSSITMDDLRVLATFVNPSESVSWTPKILISAYQSMMSQFKTIPSYSEMERVEIGNPIPSNIHRVCVSILYRWCVDLGGTTNYSMTDCEMKEYVGLLRSDRSVLINKMMDVLLKDKRLLALSIVTSSKYDYDETNNGYVSQSAITSLTASMLKTSKHTIPRSKEEAVLLAAIHYKIDISFSSKPLADYYSYTLTGVFSSPDMERIRRINPRAYCLSNTFNPIFPEAIYDITSLGIMSAESGMNAPYQPAGHIFGISNVGSGRSVDKSKYYNYLSSIHFNETFHSEAKHGVREFTTSVSMVDVENDNDHVVWFGSVPGGLIPYTVDELVGSFNENDNYVLPNRIRTLLSPDQIKKLKIIVNNNISRTHDSWTDLERSMKNIDSSLTDTGKAASTFKKYYEKLSSIDKLYANSILKSVVSIGLYMRGWNNDQSTVKIYVDNPPPSDYEQCNTNSNQAIFELRELSSSNKAVSDRILSLPLLKSSQTEDTFTIQTDKKKGLTISERLDIVSQPGNVNSCIRLTSNYLLASAYIYSKAVKLDHGYNGCTIRHIS